MNNTLWTNIHIGTCGHLSILTYTQGIISFPIIRLRIVWYYHTICYHYTRSILMRREESERMTRIHHQCLFIGHLTQILHHQSILCPILEYGTITTVCNQFMRMLCNSLIKVVLNHHHDGCRLFRVMRIFVDRTRIHLISRAETVHIDTTILA